MKNNDVKDDPKCFFGLITGRVKLPFTNEEGQEGIVWDGANKE